MSNQIIPLLIFTLFVPFLQGHQKFVNNVWTLELGMVTERELKNSSPGPRKRENTSDEMSSSLFWWTSPTTSISSRLHRSTQSLPTMTWPKHRQSHTRSHIHRLLDSCKCRAQFLLLVGGVWPTATCTGLAGRKGVDAREQPPVLVERAYLISICTPQIANECGYDRSVHCLYMLNVAGLGYRKAELLWVIDVDQIQSYINLCCQKECCCFLTSSSKLNIIKNNTSIWISLKTTPL